MGGGTVTSVPSFFLCYETRRVHPGVAMSGRVGVRYEDASHGGTGGYLSPPSPDCAHAAFYGLWEDCSMEHRSFQWLRPGSQHSVALWGLCALPAL